MKSASQSVSYHAIQRCATMLLLLLLLLPLTLAIRFICMVRWWNKNAAVDKLDARTDLLCSVS